ANVAPALCSKMQEATLAGDFVTALEIQDRLMPLHHSIFVEPGLCGAKYAMNRLGLCDEEMRAPLFPVSQPTRDMIDNGLRHAGLLN
ncbi:MAG: dihydrodipicolinate synthase family protein, partial [Marivita sp.]